MYAKGTVAKIETIRTRIDGPGISSWGNVRSAAPSAKPSVYKGRILPINRRPTSLTRRGTPPDCASTSGVGHIAFSKDPTPVLLSELPWHLSSVHLLSV